MEKVEAPTASFITEVTTNFHLRRESDYRYSNFALDTFVERIMDVTGIAGG